RRSWGGRRGRGSRRGARFPIPLPIKWDKWLRYTKYLILAIVLVASTKSVYPPLREICPARAFFSFELTTPLLWSVLITFIITSMLNKRFWCKYLCPLGAVLAIFNKITPLRIVSNENTCTSCGLCDRACPMDIPAVPENLRSAECIQCLECLEACPVPDTLELRLG
ncbi:MAG: 4Fe-4S binding protein, partial [Chloroflexota bacterium]|nr:4Fe-4S binding protein [Chloroflexota bacterium]